MFPRGLEGALSSASRNNEPLLNSRPARPGRDPLAPRLEPPLLFHTPIDSLLTFFLDFGLLGVMLYMYKSSFFVNDNLFLPTHSELN